MSERGEAIDMMQDRMERLQRDRDQLATQLEELRSAGAPVDQVKAVVQEALKDATQRRSSPEERLQLFVFILMRDHLPFGTFHDVLAKHLAKVDAGETLRITDLALDAASASIARKVLGTEAIK